MHFRRDINGLRALAVLSVIFFHFSLPGFSGGFIGVDVFFVISGFLMTGIILADNKKNEFSILGFYASRTRRILPALTALCFLLLAGGYFWLGPSDYAQLGKHASSSVSFISNFIYKGEEGYFDAPSRDKWLLHTWSLSVEWQFYLLYPLLIAGILKYGKKKEKVRSVLGGLGVLSLLFSVIISPLKPEFSFYLLPTRMWEMIAGGLVYLWPAYQGRQSRKLEAAGIAMIAVSVFLFSEDTAWPGYLALLPVIGTVLVLRANRPDSFLAVNATAQNIGKWSYSIYLWHWPVIVALHYFGLARSSAWIAPGMALAFLLGWLSYRFIEEPFRRKDAKNMRVLLVVALITILLGLGVTYTAGVPARVDESITRIDNEIRNRNKLDHKYCGFDKDNLTLKKPCITGDGTNVGAALWGDSHASTMITPLQEASGKNVAVYTRNCVTIFNTRIKSKERDNPCPTFNDLVFADIQKLPPNVPVIIANRLSYYIQGANEGIHKRIKLEYTDADEKEAQETPEKRFSTRLVSTLCKIAATRKTYVIQPIPEMGEDVPKTLVRRMMAGRDIKDISLPLQEYTERHALVVSALREAHDNCGVEILDPTPFLCKSGSCIGSENGFPLYFDDDHLSEYGNRRLVPMFKQLFTRKKQP